MIRLASDRAPLTAPRLVVPAYFRPDTRPDDWQLLAKHAQQVRLVILNLANGPGARPDPAYHSALSRLREAGVAVAGYVDTNCGRRPAVEALADLDLFLQWYAVSGVCFDRVSVTAEHLGYTPRCPATRAGPERAWCCSTTARIRLRRTPSTRTCSARSRARGAPT